MLAFCAEREGNQITLGRSVKVKALSIFRYFLSLYLSYCNVLVYPLNDWFSDLLCYSKLYYYAQYDYSVLYKN